MDGPNAADLWHAVAFNSGSSSPKFGLYELQDGHPACVVSADAHGIGEAGSVFRVVHGGPALRQHCRIDDAVMRRLEAAQAFAPLHTPAVLSVIRSAQAEFRGPPQVALFDTVFHARMPVVWPSVLPLSAALRAQGIQRYGFHGLSCESIVLPLA